MHEYLFHSTRLGFRDWWDADLKAFAEMNADPLVREFFPGVLTAAESETQLRQIQEHFSLHGFGFNAVDELRSGELIGFIGLKKFLFDVLGIEAVEIGWRLRKKFWNNGYATEGAKRCLEFGFENLGLEEIYSFTTPLNARSEAVMKKCGMKYVAEFEHPGVQEGNRLRKHVLYKIENPQKKSRIG